MKCTWDVNRSDTFSTSIYLQVYLSLYHGYVTRYLCFNVRFHIAWILQVSFLIPPEIVPGRMALLVTLFLVLTNIYTNVENQSPVSNSTNLLSIWVMVCLVFVFGALMAYAAILFMRYKSYSELQAPNKTSWLKVIDMTFLAIFPALFGVFNLFYWSHAASI